MPVFNADIYLSAAIKSILDQTYENFELILINDGSTDNSGDICEYYNNIDKRISLIHQENQGTSAARNKGLQIARGDYILFVDNDDIISKDLLYDNINILNKTGFEIVKFSINYVYLDRSGKKREIDRFKVKDKLYSITDIAKNYDYLREVGVFTFIWNMLIKKSVITDNNLKFNEEMLFGCEDNIFNFNCLKHTNGLVCNSKAYYTHFRRISISNATKYNLKKVQSTINLAKEEKNFLDSLNISNKLWNKYLVEYVSSVMYLVFDKRNQMTFKEKISYLEQIQFNNQIQINIIGKELISLLLKCPKYTVVTLLYSHKMYKFLKLLEFIKRKE
jgi:glycosyltransferase involved in cell wall biosynthesis